MHARHIVPWQFRNNAIVQAAAQKGFHMNDFINGVPLKKHTKIEFPDGVHASHPAYNDFVEYRLKKFMQDEFGNDVANIDPDMAKTFLEYELIPDLNYYINQLDNYNGNLNGYFKFVVNPNAGI